VCNIQIANNFSTFLSDPTHSQIIFHFLSFYSLFGSLLFDSTQSHYSLFEFFLLSGSVRTRRGLPLIMRQRYGNVWLHRRCPKYLRMRLQIRVYDACHVTMCSRMEDTPYINMFHVWKILHDTCIHTHAYMHVYSCENVLCILFILMLLLLFVFVIILIIKAWLWCVIVWVRLCYNLTMWLYYCYGVTVMGNHVSQIIL
jgi:hypothetical protein